MSGEPRPAFIQEQIPLAAYSTFAIGGPARYLAVVSSVAEMAQALRYGAAQRLPHLIIGRGSNCLFDDAGYNGLVIVNKINFLTEEDEGVFYAGAGFSFARLGLVASRRQRGGLEFAVGIPGSVGGAIAMNAGANGRETADALLSVELLDGAGRPQLLARSELSFGYRQSPFQRGFDGAIVAARVATSAAAAAPQRQQEILKQRTATQPYDAPSAGCIFRNPSQGSAGRIIDELGLKGTSVGGASVSRLHANFIVNDGSARSADVRRLIALLRQRVSAAHGIDLQTEVCYIAPDPSVDDGGDDHG